MSETPSKASEWREANRKIVALPSGRSVRIRKLSAQFIMEIDVLFEALLEASEKVGVQPARPGPRKAFRFTAAQYKDYLEKLVCASVVEPRVVPDGQAAKDEELNVSDFGPDLDPLVKAIHDWNGEVIRFGGAGFPEEADRVAPPPAGEDLRGEPIGAPGEAAQ